MKKILLMFVVLITSIANAQTFNFECVLTPFESELNSIYSANEAPTGYASGSAIEDAALNTPSVKADWETFFARLDGDIVQFSFVSPNTPTNITLTDGVNITSPYNKNLSSHTSQEFSEFVIKVITRMWYLENPPTLEKEIAAIYAANTPPTALGSFLDAAAVTANSEVGTTNESRRAFMTAFDKYGIVFTGFGSELIDGTQKHVAEYDNNSDFPSVAIPNGNDVSDSNFKAWALAVAQAIWHYGHPTYNPLEGELQAIYDADTPPTELGPEAIAAATEAYNVDTNASLTNFLFELDNESPSFISLVNSSGAATYAVLDDNADTEANRTYSPNKVILVAGSIELDEYKGFVFNIVEALWYAQHPEAAAAVRKADRIDEISAIDVNGDGASITHAAPTFSITNGDLANISNIDISDAILNNSDATEFNAKKVEIQTAYGDQVTKFATRTARINTLENKGNGYVTVTHAYNDNVGDLFNVTYGNIAQPIYADDYYGLGYVRLESLVTSQFDALSSAITEKINELSPSVEKELNAFATGDEPTGSAPEWLPTALYASADTNTNGTKRTAFLVSLSGHGVNITHILNDGSATTHFRVSTGDGYDYTISWAPYTSGGWNQMTAESFRRLAFDIIVLKWKKIHLTHNTKRSDILDQELDLTGTNDVELITYGSPNYDWWIYFNINGVQIPILSGGVSYDPMYYNKYTANPHDTYMTEAEFQRLVVFVTYMRDNYTSLIQITGDDARNNAITNMAIATFGAGVVYDYPDGSTHFTFTKNGISSQPVQSNWSLPAGTTLAQLSPDNWVKFYAKCRGILIGL